MTNINDLIDMGKKPMLTDNERKGIEAIADMFLSEMPTPAPFRSILISEEAATPMGLVLKAGLEALKPHKSDH